MNGCLSFISSIVNINSNLVPFATYMASMFRDSLFHSKHLGLGDNASCFCVTVNVLDVCVFPACHHHPGSGEICMLSEEEVALRSEEEPGQKRGRLALVS